CRCPPSGRRQWFVLPEGAIAIGQARRGVIHAAPPVRSVESQGSPGRDRRSRSRPAEITSRLVAPRVATVRARSFGRFRAPRAALRDPVYTPPMTDGVTR